MQFFAFIKRENSDKNMDVVHVTPRLKRCIEKIINIHGKSLEMLKNVFVSYNYDLRIAGECVRNLLLGKIPICIELITSATPHALKNMFGNEKNVLFSISDRVFKKYNTVTVRLTKDSWYKILIISVEADTDSSPKFANNWERDAYDRIFTVDAMFLDFNGKIYDYFNGYNDIKNSRVRIAGDPDLRFSEDCMRILKFFRLFASISNQSSAIDREILNAIKANIKKLEDVNGELIWNEIKVILLQPMRGIALETFIECGGATCLGLPDNLNFSELREVSQERVISPKCAVAQSSEDAKKSKLSQVKLLGISHLCSLLQTQADVDKVHQRLKLSAYERDLAKFLVKYKEKTKNIEDFVYYKELCLLPLGANRHISKEYVLELLNYKKRTDLCDKLRKTIIPPFPINERLLQSKGIRNESIEDAMSKLKNLWLQRKFNITCDELMKELPAVLEQQTESDYEMVKKKAKLE